MFLRSTRERNPELIAAAVHLHQTGQIGPNTYVLDIDRVVENARLMARIAGEHGLSLYAMTKQAGRNPFLARAAVAGGIPAAVTVEPAEARLLHSHGIPLGNVGHLVQIPAHDMADILAMGPDVVTVFSLEAAERVAEAARHMAAPQDLLLRVMEPGDFSYRGQEGGFLLEELGGAVERLAALPSVRIAGVTAFPCLLVDRETGAAEPTPNFSTLLEAARILRDDFGLNVRQVNAPSVTCAATIPLLAAMGATHGEPGSSLTGNTPLHTDGGQPEVPAQVYVSEVATVRDDRAYCFGGGFYARSNMAGALLFSRGSDEPVELGVDPLPPGIIDYYGALLLPPGVRPRLGDTVVFAFRAQTFVTRAQVAAVGGIAQDEPDLLGICDASGNLLGDNELPVGTDTARNRADDAWSRYQSGGRT